MSASTETLDTVNQRALKAAIAEVRALLENKLAKGLHAESPALDTVEANQPEGVKTAPAPEVPSSSESAPSSEPAPASSLDTLVARFQLTPFERGILLLCAGIEFDSSFAELYASAQNGQRAVTFGLALAVLPDPHWSALAPTGSLRRWRIIDVDTTNGLTSAPLRLDERVLHFLAGVSYFDPRLRGFFHRVHGDNTELAPAQTVQAQRIVDFIAQAQLTGEVPLFDLQGTDPAARVAVAHAASSTCDLKLFRINALDLPAAAEERDTLSRLWEREALLGASALLIVATETNPPEIVSHARTLVERTRGIVFFSGPDPLPASDRVVLTLAIDKPAPAEQLTLWTRALGSDAARLNGQLAHVAAQFNLDTRGVRAAAQDFTTRLTNAQDEEQISPLLWSAARKQARVALDCLALPIEPTAHWEDIVLPSAQLQTLRTIVAQVRQRAHVCETWGFSRKGARGLGLSTLFAGPSGTGKTMAAEVLASELDLDLFRIDLSGMVSKYIGETEKNLRRVFDAADQSGAILLFDEADALFGKRSEVRDSHDRYANIEVSYLLQRIEAYRGLAILTTNMKQAVDTAFMRRLRFVVPFVFPDTAQRIEIWKRVFPSETPTENLDYRKLARLSLAGGHIRNVALNAAFLAADAGEPVRMQHLLRAAQGEYAKLEKPLTEAEFGGWA